MSQAQTEFNQAKEKFLQNIPKEENEIVEKIRHIINEVGKSFSLWDSATLAATEEILARLCERLAEFWADYDTQSEWLKAYVDEQIAKDWDTEQEAIKQLRGKATATEIERILRSKYWVNTSEMILLRGRAKRSKALIDAIDRVLLALTHRLHELRRQVDVYQNPRQK